MTAIMMIAVVMLVVFVMVLIMVLFMVIIIVIMMFFMMVIILIIMMAIMVMMVIVVMIMMAVHAYKLSARIVTITVCIGAKRYNESAEQNTHLFHVFSIKVEIADTHHLFEDESISQRYRYLVF